MVQKWKASPIFEGLCVVGLCSRVESFVVIEGFKVEFNKKESRLMMVEVKWRTKLGGRDSDLVIVGHLHNELAKKKDAFELKKFWNKLADLCAGGGRLIGADMNMAMFGVLPEMHKRGVGISLLAHHYELEDPDDELNEQLLFDSMGLWAVGPVKIKDSTRCSRADHIFWGAAHPKNKKIKRCNFHCGFPVASHKWHPPFVHTKMPAALAAGVDKVRA